VVTFPPAFLAVTKKGEEGAPDVFKFLFYDIISAGWCAVASPGEEGQRWKLCHGALTVDFRAGCSSCSMTNSFVTNAVLIVRKSCELLTSASANPTVYTILG